jgi:thioredoxin reductase
MARLNSMIAEIQKEKVMQRIATIAPTLPVAIVGSGPVGLAAAAELAERGLPFVLFEKAQEPAAAIAAWGHVRLFSPWAFNTAPAAERLLAGTGWARPPAEHHPTGQELRDLYLLPLAGHPAIASALRLGTEVTAIARAGTDRLRSEARLDRPFVVRTRGAAGESELLAGAVIDASGTWGTPNRSRSGGLGALGETRDDVARHMSYAMPDVLGRERRRFAGRRVAVLGSGHSALGTLLDLDRLAVEEPRTQVTWLIRSRLSDLRLADGGKDQLAARGALATSVAGLLSTGRVTVRSDSRVDTLSVEGGSLVIRLDDATALAVDEFVVATGFRPDHSLAAELRLSLDPAVDCPTQLAPLIDPNLHSCGTVRPHGHAVLAHPDAGYAIVGMKSYGRAPTFLMATGYEQVRSVVAHLAGDSVAAADVKLVLPETGVCSTDRLPAPAAGCCGSTRTTRVAEMQD